MAESNFGASEIVLIAILISSFFVIRDSPEITQRIKQAVSGPTVTDPDIAQAPQPDPEKTLVEHETSGGGGGYISYSKDPTNDECYLDCVNSSLYEPWCYNYCYHLSSSCYLNQTLVDYWCCYDQSYVHIDGTNWCCPPDYPNYCGLNVNVCWRYPNIGNCTPSHDMGIYTVIEDSRGGAAWRFTDNKANWSNVIHYDFYDDLVYDNIAVVISPVENYTYARWINIDLDNINTDYTYKVSMRSQGFTRYAFLRWDHILNNINTSNFDYHYRDVEGYTWDSWTFKFDPGSDGLIRVGGLHDPNLNELVYIDEIIISPVG